MRRSTSLAAVVASAACFGTLAVLTSKAYEYGATPLPLLAWRFAITAGLMALYQAAVGPAELRVTRGDLGRYALLALTGYGAASLCFFFALRLASAPVVSVLLYTYPAMVSAAGWVLFGERFSWPRLTAIGMTFMGCALVLQLFSAHAAASLGGILLGLGAAVGYSVFNILSFRWMGRRPRVVLMTYTFGISSLAFVLVTMAAGQSLSPARWSARLWLVLGLIVVVPTFVAVLLYLRGMKGVGASQAAIVSTFEPLFTILLAAVFLGQRLDALQWAGALLVLGGVAIAEWRPGTVAPEEAAAV